MTILIKKTAPTFPGYSSRSTKVICYGDSWTAGQLGYMGFSTLLGNYYTALNANQGYPGQTSSFGLSNLSADVLNSSPQVCIMAWGVNDANNNNTVPLATFQSNIDSMVSQMQTANIQVILWTQALSTTSNPMDNPNTVNDSAWTSNYVAYLTAIRTVASKYNTGSYPCQLVDFAQTFQNMRSQQGANFSSWWANNLHMNQTFQTYAYNTFKKMLIGSRKTLEFYP